MKTVTGITDADRAQLSAIVKRAAKVNDGDTELLLKLLSERDQQIAEIIVAAAMAGEDDAG